ncbi:MAG: CAP domain-containing protein [Campylobacterota bacterium]|nr:CAP domain-containing protein [Campylobacterota bacterium]
MLFNRLKKLLYLVVINTLLATSAFAVTASTLTSPSNGATLTSSTQTFTWEDTGADMYYLFVGTSAGGHELYASNQGTATSRTISNLPSGTIYVRLWTWIDDAWQPRDSTYYISSSEGDSFSIPLISDAQKAEYLNAINTIRSQPQNCGSEGYFPAVHALSWNDALYKAAYEHSYDLANSGTFSHTGSGTIYDITAQNLGLTRGSLFYERIANYNYSGSTTGENIAAGQSTTNEVMAGWMASDGHCANIMSSSFTEFGMALITHNSGYRYYWTQNFGG